VGFAAAEAGAAVVVTRLVIGEGGDPFSTRLLATEEAGRSRWPLLAWWYGALRLVTRRSRPAATPSANGWWNNQRRFDVTEAMQAVPGIGDPILAAGWLGGEPCASTQDRRCLAAIAGGFDIGHPQ